MRISQGRPKLLADWKLCDAFGVWWRCLALHRQLWAAAIVAFVSPSLPQKWQNEVTVARLGLRVPLMNTKSLKDIRYLDFISNKHRDCLASGRLNAKVQLIIFCSSEVALAMISGASKPTLQAASHVKYIRWMLYLLEIRWGCECWPGMTEICQFKHRDHGILYNTLLREPLEVQDPGTEWICDKALGDLKTCRLVVTCEARVHGMIACVGSAIQHMTAEGEDVLHVCRMGIDSGDVIVSALEACALSIRALVKCMFVVGVAETSNRELHQDFCQLSLV